MCPGYIYSSDNTKENKKCFWKIVKEITVLNLFVIKAQTIIWKCYLTNSKTNGFLKADLTH